MIRIAEYRFPREKCVLCGILVGIIAGVANMFVSIDFSLRPALFAWLLSAIVAIVVLHEAVHAGTARIFGHNPVIGLKPPLVYTTFSDKIPRCDFMVIAAAPLVLLDVLFGLFFAFGFARLFSFLCATINTMGAVGDIWILYKLCACPRNAFILDTKTGIEVWQEKE
jgi:hypothetical protein